ncbi:MAG: homoserine O-succinyltransferase [Muribaculaceae bacterium]|nr:homoserine O-succinyltransferase [Muribaculaceae bacterium]HUN21033.1 homoserine O-succinyltransferase [Muribaculaceae bacterium]
MPIHVENGLPAIDMLKMEGIRIHEMPQTQPCRWNVALVNLMPEKIPAEADILRLMARCPLETALHLYRMASHRSRNTSGEHLERFYTTHADSPLTEMDGVIINGAPLERVRYEDVDYWNEFRGIMDACEASGVPVLYLCWAAFAGLYARYGLDKSLLERKLSGVYRHVLTAEGTGCPLMSGFDDIFFMPHSRHCQIDQAAAAKESGLSVLAYSPDGPGAAIMADRNGLDFYITGHAEYSPMTLDSEYRRDAARGLNPSIPENYYPDDNPDNRPEVRWRAHANLLMDNWLDKYVCVH